MPGNVEVDRNGDRVVGGLAGWLIGKMQGKGRGERRLALLEKISLAPKHSIALIEAEGHHLLVAVSADSAPVFHVLGGPGSRVMPADQPTTDARNFDDLERSLW